MASPISAEWNQRLRSVGQLLALGSAFGLSGLGAVTLSAGFLPLMLLPRPLSRRCSRQLLGRSLRLLLEFLRLAGLVARAEYRGLEHLRKDGQLLTPTHPSLLDALYLIALVPGASCIVKSSLWRNPLTAVTVRALGYQRNDDPELLEQCVRQLERGDSLIIFPEGTRTRFGAPLRLRRGAAYLALAARSDLTPVVVRCEPTMPRVGDILLALPEPPPRFSISIDVLPPLPVAPYLNAEQPRSLRARRLTEELGRRLLTIYSTTEAATQRSGAEAGKSDNLAPR